MWGRESERMILSPFVFLKRKNRRKTLWELLVGIVERIIFARDGTGKDLPLQTRK